MTAAPEKLGKYHVLERLAQGGMAEIYKVKTVGIAGFEKVQVLKRILPGYARNDRFIRAFIDEARIAVSLNHRNIVQIFEFGKADGELFLAMEFIDGVNLREIMLAARAQKRPIPPALVCHLIAEVASGLDYAHRKADHQGRPLGIVHCDISPANIVVSTEGFVKILDFGIARASFAMGGGDPARAGSDPGGRGALPPKENRVRGKPRYMAPEQVRGDAPTVRTDVFALGIVTWEALAGRGLFEAPDVESILQAIVSREIPALDAISSEIPSSLASLVGQLLQRDPGARPASAADVVTRVLRVQREIDMSAGSRALSLYLAELFPERQRLTQPPGDETAPSRLRAPTRPGVDFQGALAPAPPRPGRVEIEGLVKAGKLAAPPSAEREVRTPSVLKDLLRDVPASPTSAPLGEKRRVVAVAARMDGGTREARAELRRLLGDVAYKHDAVVQDADPDDPDDPLVLALFGLERATEDDVAQAMAYGLDALEVARSLPRTGQPGSRVEALPGPPLTLRLGARQGIVARRHAAPGSDPRAGSDGRGDAYLLLGDAVEEAASLAETAQPGRVVLGGSASRQASAHYAFREIAPARRRGRRLRCLELLGPRAPHERVAQQLGRRGAFVGRKTEIAELEQAFRRATSTGRVTMAALIGEPGVGKSRVARELADQLMPEAQVLTAGCSPTSRDAPFALVVDFLHALAGVAPMRGPRGRERVLDRLDGALHAAGLLQAEREETLGALARVLALHEGEPGVDASEPAATASLRERVVGALAVVTRELTNDGRPFLCIIEDVHWIDAPSREALARLVATGATAPGLVLLTARPDDKGQVPRFIPPSADPVLRLGELAAADSEILVRDRLGADVAPEILGQVVRRAGGNPLFLEEIVTALGEQATVGADIPETVRGVIASRVDRLPPATKAVLQYAAVSGPTFTGGLLVNLFGRSSEKAIASLVARGLITPVGGRGTEPGDVETSLFSFRHELIQEVVYQALSGAGRRDAHRRIGERLAARYQSGRADPPAAIARHLELGGNIEEAASFFVRAGQLAEAAFAAREAVEYFDRALELGGRTVEQGSAPNPEREYAAYSGREQAYFQLGMHAEQERDLAALERRAHGNPRNLADLKNREARRLLRLGQLEKAIATTRQAEHAAEIAIDERARGQALRLRGEAYERQSDYGPALESVGRALEIFRRVGAAAEESTALVGLGRINLMSSRYDVALGHYTPALERVKRTGDAWLERVIRNNLSVIHLVRGEFELAYAECERSLAICKRFGDRAREGDNVSVLGIILMELGRYGEARAKFDESLAIHTETGSRWSEADTLVYAGACDYQSDDAERGVARLERAIAMAGEIGAKYIAANAKAALAWVLCERKGPGDFARAARLADEAATTGRLAGIISCEIPGLSRAARAYNGVGDLATALERSARAVELLDRQRNIEGSEEEIYYTRYRIMRASGDPAAFHLLARAHQGLEAKLRRIENLDWRRSYAEDIRLHVRIRRDFAVHSSIGRIA